MLQVLRINPGLLITASLLAGGAIVSLLLGLLMKRSGASLRPVFWFAGFFALVVLPQFFGHLYVALNTTKGETSLERSLPNEGAASNERETNAKALFGADVDPQLVVDARKMMGDIFGSAEYAQFAALPNGDTVLLARFNGYSAAEKAWVAYLRQTGLGQLGGKGDSQRGYVVTRPVGDRAYVLHLRNLVGVWTGKDDRAIRERMLAGGFEIPRKSPLLEAAEAAPDSVQQTASTPRNPALLAVLLVLYLFVVVAYFFKGAAWAGSSPAKEGAALLPAEDLARRLEGINELAVPFKIEKGPGQNEYFATWRYADAKWADLARARGMRRTFRIRLRLDEQKHVVRATDYAASFDWSVGRGGADLEWKAALGIVFFHYEHQRVLGLQWDEQGRFQPQLSYAYTFNLHEMKSPLMEAVTRAGWTWRPTIWQGPVWLRWLTE